MKVLLDPFRSEAADDIIATSNTHIGEHRGQKNDPEIYE
jgi:hypothetical protein